MRKSKRCTRTKIETLNGLLVMRTCLFHRGHDGRCHDKRGAWK